MTNGIYQVVSNPVLEQAVKFAEARHNVLAGNIANIDTPGYRARDLSTTLFQQRLMEAIEARDTPGSEGSDKSDDPSTISDPTTSMVDAFETILQHDDGKVSLEQQVAELTKNQMQYNTALALLTSQIHSLEAAIKEQA